MSPLPGRSGEAANPLDNGPYLALSRLWSAGPGGFAVPPTAGGPHRIGSGSGGTSRPRPSGTSEGCCNDDDDDAATVELPTEGLEVYENYTEALLSADGEAMLEYVTDDFTWLSYGTNLMDAEYRADDVTENYGSFEVEESDERTVVGGGGSTSSRSKDEPPHRASWTGSRW